MQNTKVKTDERQRRAQATGAFCLFTFVFCNLTCIPQRIDSHGDTESARGAKNKAATRRKPRTNHENTKDESTKWALYNKPDRCAPFFFAFSFFVFS